jgi:ABC-type nitrate/sulfonate/bicarbonate transport system ATPase subunit
MSPDSSALAATAPLPHGKLCVEGVSKAFHHHGKATQAIADVSLNISEGEFVSIIGPSGSGKSTLFNIIAGLQKPDSGRVLVDGQDVTGRPEACAYMPQRDLLFPWRTVIDNTVLGLEIQGMKREAARRQVAPLFADFGIAGFENHYPFQLSGGMRQRAALLRTVVQGRSVLLLDEPFGALDSLTRSEMQEWLTNVWQARRWTVLLVTHDIREAVFLSDRVYVLSPSPGRVKCVVECQLPRPRSLATLEMVEFAHYEAVLAQALRHVPENGAPPRVANFPKKEGI